MKTLILDKSKWICGDPTIIPIDLQFQPNTSLGIGTTALLNRNGYMCCLGQFAKQINPEVTDNMIKLLGAPGHVYEDYGILIDKLTNKNGKDSKLSKDAISINDNKLLTVDQKIDQLKKLFAKYDFEIEVIN